MKLTIARLCRRIADRLDPQPAARTLTYTFTGDAHALATAISSEIGKGIVGRGYHFRGETHY